MGQDFSIECVDVYIIKNITSYLLDIEQTALRQSCKRLRRIICPPLEHYKDILMYGARHGLLHLCQEGQRAITGDYCFEDLLFTAAQYGHIDIIKQAYKWEVLRSHFHAIPKQCNPSEGASRLLKIIIRGAIKGNQYDLIKQLIVKNRQDFPFNYLFCNALKTENKQLVQLAIKLEPTPTYFTVDKQEVTSQHVIDGMPWNGYGIDVNGFMSRDIRIETTSPENRLFLALEQHDIGAALDVYACGVKINHLAATFYCDTPRCWWDLIFLWFDPPYIANIMDSAAYHGNETVCQMAKDHGARNFRQIFRDSVFGGRLRICWLMKYWCPTITRYVPWPVNDTYYMYNDNYVETTAMLTEWDDKYYHDIEEKWYQNQINVL